MVGALAVAVAIALLTSSVGIEAVPAALEAPTPSDPRADAVEGNATNCADVGFAGDVQMGSGTNTDAADANVSGTVKLNAGTTQPGQGEEVDVAIVGTGIVVDVIVVKGGPAYNVYSDPSGLPPSLAPDQHYISPLNGGGNVPAISHWFVCYHLATPPPAGSLTVTKTVIAPGGIPVDFPPLSYTAIVDCDDGDPAHENVVVTFGRGGGLGGPSETIGGLTAGTTCTVVEQNTASLPADTVVRYEPTGADSTGVVIPAGGSATATIVNDFSAIAIRTGTVRVEKAVVGGGSDMPGEFNARVVCDDGTNTVVSLPLGGGPGTPDVTVPLGSLCFVREMDVASLRDSGWTIDYAMDGDPSQTLPPLVGPIFQATTDVTITNTGPAAPSTTTTIPASPVTPTAAAPANASTDPTAAGPSIARTGWSPRGLVLGTLFIAIGTTLLLTGRRCQRRGRDRAAHTA
jgi:hypothetical protein